MNRFLFCLSVLLLWAGGLQRLSAREAAGDTLPRYPQAGGVSAPFAGFVGSRLLVAGGCNFPGVPAADGGQKVFHATAFALDADSPSPAWTSQPALPAPVAYGASVATPGGLVCIGGQNAGGPVADVYLLKPDGSTSALPPLPAPVDNGGAALIGKTLYVTGGNQPGGARALYALDLAEAGASWARLPDYPGLQRVQPVVAASADALYLVGGYAFDAGRKVCTPATDVLQYDPATHTWSRLDVLPAGSDGTPRCLVGGSGVCCDGRLYLAGGVNRDIFCQAMEGKAPADYMRRPPEWYRFNDDLLVYDLRTRRWEIRPGVPGLARAGGVLLEHGGRLYMICGEIKPGVRSQQITVVPR